jgi:hypothetical protein
LTNLDSQEEAGEIGLFVGFSQALEANSRHLTLASGNWSK